MFSFYSPPTPVNLSAEQILEFLTGREGLWQKAVQEIIQAKAPQCEACDIMMENCPKYITYLFKGQQIARFSHKSKQDFIFGISRSVVCD